MSCHSKNLETTKELGHLSVSGKTTVRLLCLRLPVIPVHRGLFFTWADATNMQSRLVFLLQHQSLGQAQRRSYFFFIHLGVTLKNLT